MTADPREVLDLGLEIGCGMLAHGASVSSAIRASRHAMRDLGMAEYHTDVTGNMIIVSVRGKTDGEPLTAMRVVPIGHQDFELITMLQQVASEARNNSIPDSRARIEAILGRHGRWGGLDVSLGFGAVSSAAALMFGARWIVGRGGHYVFTVKNNQPGVRRTLKRLPWKDVPSVSSVDSSRGRRVRRTVKAAWAPAWVDFPEAAQVLQVRRTRTTRNRKSPGKNGKAKRTTVEVVYLVCSLPMEQAQPEQVAAWVQGHWGIENRLHWVRDVVFDEDRHQLRTRNGPEIMAALRNLAIGLIRLVHGPGAGIASTTRSLSRRPKRAIKLITQPST